MGHLGKAQQNLKNDSNVIKIQAARQQEASKVEKALSIELKEKVIYTLLYDLDVVVVLLLLLLLVVVVVVVFLS